MITGRKRHIKYKEENKERKVNFLLRDFEDCKSQIKEISSQLKCDLEYIEKMKLLRDYDILASRKSSISAKLESLGVRVEKRGRPSKSEEDKYYNIRSKFTAMLLTENLEYLKKLKEDKKIKNISDFIDNLIEEHRGNS